MATSKKLRPASRPVDIDVPMRITLVSPPAGVQFCLGRSDGDAEPPKLSTGRPLSFDLTLRARGVNGDEPFRFLGRHARGTPQQRFIAIGVGQLAAQPDSCWTRVIKVHLSDITPRMVQDVARSPKARLEARVNGTGRDGTPSCATVPLLDGGWKVVR